MRSICAFFWFSVANFLHHSSPELKNSPEIKIAFSKEDHVRAAKREIKGEIVHIYQSFLKAALTAKGKQFFVFFLNCMGFGGSC